MTEIKLKVPVVTVVEKTISELSDDELEQIFDLVSDEMEKRDIFKELDEDDFKRIEELVYFIENNFFKTR